MTLLPCAHSADTWVTVPAHLTLGIRRADGAAAVRCTRCKVAERYQGTMKDLGRWVSDVTSRHERCETRLIAGEAAE